MAQNKVTRQALVNSIVIFREVTEVAGDRVKMDKEELHNLGS
jgi:hypothetical protein